MIRKAKKIINKNLSISEQYGPFGLFRVYARTIIWHLFNVLTGKNEKYKKVRVNDYDMFIDLRRNDISKALFVYGTREEDQMHVIKKYLQHGSKVLDIGANIGYYVILESSIIGPSAKVIAYEPSYENCVLLKKNVELNRLGERVQINNAAVSNKSGRSKFYLSEKSNWHTLNPKFYKGHRKEKLEEVTVVTVDIYGIINEHRDIKFIRMDIEGHEVEVLDGLTKAAADFNVYPDILFETHFPKYDPLHHDMGEKLERLFKLGYFPKVFISNNKEISGLAKRGYKPNAIIATDRVRRAIYDGISKGDTLDFICKRNGSRAVLLSRTLR